MAQSVIADAQDGRQRHYFAFDVPWMGTIDVEINGVTRGDTFFDASHKPGKSYVEIWAGPVWVCLERGTSIRFKRGTLAVLGMTAMALAGWTEGHLWHLPFLG